MEVLRTASGEMSIVKQISENIFNFYDSDYLCDVTLVVGIDGKRLSAHRVILAAASEYFRGLFTSQFNDKEKDEFKINDVDGDLLKQVIEYCYTGVIAINEENIESLMEAASFLLIPQLRKDCIEYLLSNINLENCVSIWVVAKRYNYQDVERVFSFICEKFVKITKFESFYDLHKSELKQILLNLNVVVNYEDRVFNAIVDWVKFDSNGRKSEFPDLIETIRVDHLNDAFFNQEFRFACEEFDCTDKFDKLEELRSQRSKKRKTEAAILAVTLRPYVELLKYSLSAVWQPPKVMNLSVQLKECAVVIVDRTLYFIGDLDHSFNLDELKLKSINRMPTRRRSLSVVADRDFIYAVGGENLMGEALTTVERYNIKFKKWTTVAPLSGPRCSAAIVNLSGDIFVIGGKRSDTPQEWCEDSNYVEKYDPIRRKWTTVAPLLKNRAPVAADVSEGYIYVAGVSCEWKNRFEIERYDPGADEWTLLRFVPRNCWTDFGMCVYDDWIYLAGGSNRTFEKIHKRTGEKVELNSAQNDMYFTNCQFLLPIM